MKKIVWCLSLVILLASWALTVDGFFVSPEILRHADRERAEAVAEEFDAAWEDVSLRATDGVTLRGWLFTPHNGRNRAVLLVHAGVGNRHEMLGRAGWLLQSGYQCLVIDQRGCGTSGGQVTWGVREPADVAAWAGWLRARTGAAAVFGCGLSRGSTTLLQSLALKAPFDGLALEATGAGNIGHPYQFISDKTGMPVSRARMLAWPFIEPTFWWIRARHGFDMKSALDGVTAIRDSNVPVLLIHGSADRGATLSGAQRLRDANPQHTELVVIEGADHQWFSPGRPEVMKRVLAWLDARAR